MEKRTGWMAAALAVLAMGAPQANAEELSRTELRGAAAFAWTLCNARGAVAVYECDGPEGSEEGALVFRRTDEAKLNAPEVLLGNATIGGMQPIDRLEAVAGSRWMFALQEPAEDMDLRNLMYTGMLFLAPDGTGGTRRWMVAHGHGIPVPARNKGIGCLAWPENAGDRPSRHGFPADEAEWADVKAIAAAMGQKGWQWTPDSPEGAISTPWGREVWRVLGDAVDNLTPAKKKAAECFARALAGVEPDGTLGFYRVLPPSKAEELFGNTDRYRELMANPPFPTPSEPPWLVLYRLEALLPGAPEVLYVSRAFILREEISMHFKPPPETRWALSLVRCTEENRPPWQEFVLPGQDGPGNNDDFFIAGSPGRGKRNGPDGLACLRWPNEWWLRTDPPPDSLLDDAEIADLRMLAEAARNGDDMPPENLSTRWGREIAATWRARESLP